MPRTPLFMPKHPSHDVPDELEPTYPPVEPDEGPIPAYITGDPEHERVIDPGENAGQLAQFNASHVKAAKCL